jgi:nuclear pore complex protein Nup85
LLLVPSTISNCVLSNKLLICMGMPSFAAVAPNAGALVPLQQQGSDSSDSSTAAVLHTVYHRVQGAPRILVSWGHGNCLRLSYLQQQHEPENESNPNGLQPAVAKGNGGGKVVEIELGKKDENQTLAEKRRIAYASVQAFAYLQSQQLMQIEAPSRAYGTDWWQHVLEYSHSISAALGPSGAPPGSASDVSSDPSKDSYQLTTVKAIWDFLEVFYVDKNAASWLPERLVDWLAVSYKPGRTPLSSLYMLKDTSCFKFHVQCAQW